MAMKEPETRVISSETNGNVFRRNADVGNIVDDRLDIVGLSILNSGEAMLREQHNNLSKV